MAEPEQPKPRRRQPGKRLKEAIFARQAGRCYLSGAPLGSIWDCEWHHIPGLATRPIREDGKDYIPAQLDPDYLFAVARQPHDVSTNGPDVEQKHLLRKDHDKARAQRTRDLRDSHRAHLRAMSEKKPGQKRPRSSRWPSRPFTRPER